MDEQKPNPIYKLYLDRYLAACIKNDIFPSASGYEIYLNIYFSDPSVPCYDFIRRVMNSTFLKAEKLLVRKYKISKLLKEIDKSE